MLPEFRNEALTDFSDVGNRQTFEAALQAVRAEFGRDYPLTIGGRSIRNGAWIESVDPCQKTRVVGRVARASREDAESAQQAAKEAYEDWSRWVPEARARILLKAAALMRRRKHELSATMVYEVGKSWAEADADTAEAIDFLEFYAREMVRLAQPQPLTRIAGEDNELYYSPLGVGVIIPPWNFPLAIACGMTSSAIVAGNTVILKPASITPVIAAKFAELMHEAGLPPGVLNFLPGPGSEVGDYLVQHPGVRFVSFTGSRDVGVHIYEQASKVQPGQMWLKRVVAEMGGKNAIVVDDPSDLEDAAAGVVASAFGFQGQKCSACSRVIAVESVCDRLLERVAERTQALRLGAADDPETDVAAVASQDQFDKIIGYLDVGRREGRLVLGSEAGSPDGNYIQPTLFADVAPDARIAQEEIFGPVVAFIKAADYAQAIRIANGTQYGLTSSVYSRDRQHLEIARSEFHVGNLYLNRKCTGALVGAHPFGGFNMSGTDSKAGGRDYLRLLTQAKSVSERL